MVNTYYFLQFPRKIKFNMFIDNLNSTFGDKVPSRTSVHRLFSDFNNTCSALIS